MGSLIDGIWHYDEGETASPTFSELLNKLGDSVRSRLADDTGWVDVAPAAGFTTPIPVQVRKVGSVVHWRGSVGRTAGWTAAYVVAIPAANIPAGVFVGNLAVLLNAGGPGVVGAATMSSAGISLACATPTANINLAGISYLVG